MNRCIIRAKKRLQNIRFYYRLKEKSKDLRGGKMKNSFLDIIRIPDDIKIYTETSPFRFEEPGEVNNTDAEC